MTPAGYWNHNVHYQSIILGAVPPGCGPALDVGCGDGVLAGRPGQHSFADIGRGAVGDAQELGVGGGEDGVRVAARRPDLVVLVQPGVH